MTLEPISCTTLSDPLTKVPVKTFSYHLNCNMVEHHLVSKLSLYSQTKDDFVAQVKLCLVTFSGINHQLWYHLKSID